MPEQTIDLVQVSFQPEGRVVRVPRGTRLSAAGAAADVFVDAPCGDRGVCGKCRVRASGELGHLTSAEMRALTRAEIADGWRLACQATASGPCEVRVPRHDIQIATDGLGREIPIRPNVVKTLVSLPESSIDEAQSALARLRAALDRPALAATAHGLRTLAACHLNAPVLTATVVGGDLVRVEAGDTRARRYGLAFDIGTTTVVGALVDLSDGRELAVAATMNEQAQFGADVISRIKHATENSDGLAQLNGTIVRVLNGLIAELVERARVDRADVYEMTVVGNTTMHHLFLGLSPVSLGEAPYSATVKDAVSFPAADLGIDLGPAARVYALPVIAGHVGADTVGVVLATGLHRAEGVRLALDIGTNGESVLGSRAGLVACSNAAGPAFEGTSIRHGMRATTGAIQGARIPAGGDVELSIIGSADGSVAPRGICGSGLIDLVAELRLAGLIDENGRLLAAEEAPTGLSPALVARLETADGERCFRLSGEVAARVVLTQKDVRELQLAKGAMYAGAKILQRVLGVADEDIVEVELAGAFGSYIRPESALVVGLIPNVPVERVRAVGNAARIGAKLALTSVEARAEAEEIARTVQHQELFASPDFFDEYMSAMRFPPVESAISRGAES